MILGSNENESYNAILSFDRSQNGVFFLTNEYGEFNQLAHKDLRTNKINVLTEGIPWDIDGYAISSDHKKAAFTVNEGGIGSLYLMDTESKKYRKVSNIPIGLIGGIEFSEDGTKLGLTINSYQSPSDSYVLDLKNNPLLYGSLNRWTVSEIGGLDVACLLYTSPSPRDPE